MLLSIFNHTLYNAAGALSSKPSFWGDKKMQLRDCVCFVICLSFLVSPCLGQPSSTATKSPVPATDANKAALSFPYVAQTTGNRVNLRSGPGTNYYACGKLNKADRVVVVGSRYSWSQVVPPPGSFSWISKQYVSVDPKDRTVGTVTGFNVRVYAGSEELQPMHSTSLQLKHNKGEKVKLLGEKKDGYYKIVPPQGAYLWVLTTYTEALGPVGKVPVIVNRPKPPARSNKKARTRAASAAGSSDKLSRYYALQKQFEIERAKPLQKQNHEKIKKALEKIAADKRAGKAARYARLTLGHIESCELALEAGAKVEIQQQQLEATKKRIDKALAARLAKIEDLGKYAVVGQLQQSALYGSETDLQFYRLVDENGRTVCYAMPIGKGIMSDWSKYLNHRVGLIGQIKPHKETGSALVRFTKVIEIK